MSRAKWEQDLIDERKKVLKKRVSFIRAHFEVALAIGSLILIVHGLLFIARAIDLLIR